MNWEYENAQVGELVRELQLMTRGGVFVMGACGAKRIFQSSLGIKGGDNFSHGIVFIHARQSQCSRGGREKGKGKRANWDWTISWRFST